ncbi:prolyl oligopeptidase family serine peptidase [Akkermansiaceae bacterium]|nr:prolyl oligopeptidase family serine peptidase [Akkermansiaceae bacterium]MDB4266385.1 prolyl oligopeptidase family serine peptidase [bacterium]MDA8876334.1 prolyl oligopeptidase family serine peptidase [Akkermansiaceae bacterium]MDB4421995.1 prolyl oligopeptidase family serine peptidase [Akkermansiaceae bacterium]MDB4458172.1 prolyl oligopeptidase family serine peptidase [Akkermansiaceae bacterium]
MRSILVGLLLTSSLLYAEHGSTSSLLDGFKKRADAQRALVKDELLSITWEERDGAWFCLFNDSKGKAEVSCADGTRAERKGGFGKKPLKLEAKAGIRDWSGNRSWDGKHNVSIEKGKTLSLDSLGDWKADAPEGWLWDKRIQWSKSNHYFQATRVRDVSEREVHYVRSSPKEQLQPEHFIKRYAKPGDELRNRVPVIFSIEGKKIEVDPELIENPYSISKVHWRDKTRLWLTFIERGFGKYSLIEVNAEAGKSRVVAGESDEKFIHVFEKCGWWDLGDGKLLWRSEASGWSQFYLVDEASGERKQLTRGPGVVRGIKRIAGDEITYIFSGQRESEDPYHIHWATLNWKTGKKTLLTEADGTHELSFSPDAQFYLDRWSRADQPPVHELRKTSDGSLVTTLAKATAEGVTMPERFVAKDREGRYDIHGLIWKPVDFDPAKKYPVIENIYAGPHGAFVPKSWKSWHGHISEMTASGFVVVKLDGRGTNYRGKEFQQFAYKNLKDSGFPDRKKWITEAAKNRPWMDLSRVGLYGGSAGGQSTLAGLLWHGDFYKAGATDCGCHDNRMDKIWWNEQWMDWPIDESYATNSNAPHVEQLKGDLFITVGEVDTNVDPSSTMQVIDALIKADKDFEFYNVPNGGHGIGESSYLRRKRIEFFQRSLGGSR